MIYSMRGKRFYLNVYFSKKRNKHYYYFTRKRNRITTLPPGYIVIEGTYPIVKLVVDNIN